MKILTITRHHVYNYGASLQAYALQQFLQSLGHDVKIIDYQPIYDIGHYGFHWYIFPMSPYYNRCRNNILLRAIYCGWRGINSYRTLLRKTKFDNFEKKYLKLTDRFISLEELKLDVPSADVYIAGSDQIWFSFSLEGQDEAYYLDFVDSGKKIAYAASFGRSITNPDFEHRQKELISKFDFVGAREGSGKKILDNWGLEASHVCDPVFLLNKEEWLKLSGDKPYYNKDKYILVYNLGKESTIIKECAVQLTSKYGYKIVSINSPNKLSYGDSNYGNIGPIEFLNLIKFAEIVLTNSFHCTAFAMIMNKNFYSFSPNSKESAVRITELLENARLLNRFEPLSSDLSLSETDLPFMKNYSPFVDDSKRMLISEINI